MIFLPYVFTLQDSDQTFQTLREVQEAKGNFTSVQNDTTKLTSYLGDNPRRLFEFYERLIGNYINHYDNCFAGNFDFNSRLIQTTDSEEEEVARNIRDNNLWFLDVCNRLNITKPPVLGTVLLFYRSNISDPARAYATWGPDKDIEYFSPELTKEQVSTLEYYNASFHVGSPFWLYSQSQSHIKSLISGYNYSLSSIDRQISGVNKSLDNFETGVVDKYQLSKGINDSKEILDKLRSSLTPLQQKGIGMILNFFSVSNLDGRITAPLNNATLFKLLSAIESEMQPYAEALKLTTGLTKLLVASLGELGGVFEGNINSLNDRLNQLEIRKNETSNRLKEIEFPFGNIPIGINESILFFPVGISAGFWISASLLGDILRLRKRYHTILIAHRTEKSNNNEVKKGNDKLEEKGGEEEKKKIDEKLSLLYPVWIDPITSRPLRSVKLVILSVPAMIFVTSLYFLSDSWQIIVSQQDLEGLFIGNIRDNAMLYFASYVIGTIFFVAGYWRIFKDLRYRFSAKSALP